MTKEALANGWYQLTIKMQTKADGTDTEQNMLDDMLQTLCWDLSDLNNQQHVFSIDEFKSIYGIELTQVSDEAAKTFASL